MTPSATMLTTLTPQRKHRKLLKDGSGGEVWPEAVERIFVTGLEAYLKSNYATYSRGRSRWRNQFLVDHLRAHGIERTKKQVASHIQVLRNMWKGEPQFYLVAGGADDDIQPAAHPHHTHREGHRVSSISPSRGRRSSSLHRIGSPSRQPMSIPTAMGSFGSPANSGSPGALGGLPHSPSGYSPGSAHDMGSPSTIGSPGSVKREQLSPYGSPIGGASRSPPIKVEEDLAMDTGGPASVYDSEHVSMYDNVHVFTGLPAADGGLSVLPMNTIEGGAATGLPDLGLSTYSYAGEFKYPSQPGDAYSTRHPVEYSHNGLYSSPNNYASSQFSPQPSLVSDLSDSSMSSARFSGNMSDYQRYSLMSSTSSDAHYQSFGAYNEAPGANSSATYGALGMYNMEPSAPNGGGVLLPSGLPAPIHTPSYSGDIYKNQGPSTHAYYAQPSQPRRTASQTGSPYAQQPHPPAASAPSAQHQPHAAASAQHQPRAPAQPASPPAAYPLVSSFVVTAPGMQALHVPAGELHAQLAPTALLPGTPLCIKVQVNVEDVALLHAVQAALTIDGLWTSGGSYLTKVYRPEGGPGKPKLIHDGSTALIVRGVERGVVHADALAFAGLDLRRGDTITQDIYVDRRPVLMVVYQLGSKAPSGASITAELGGYQLAGRQSQMRQQQAQQQQQQNQQQHSSPYSSPEQQPLTVSPSQLTASPNQTVGSPNQTMGSPHQSNASPHQSGSLRRQPAHFDLRRVKSEFEGNSLMHALGA
ncbi:hypothetical protein EV715DRAFT_202999 [Schizophyllum commune]